MSNECSRHGIQKKTSIVCAHNKDRQCTLQKQQIFRNTLCGNKVGHPASRIRGCSHLSARAFSARTSARWACDLAMCTPCLNSAKTSLSQFEQIAYDVHQRVFSCFPEHVHELLLACKQSPNVIDMLLRCHPDVKGWVIMH